MPSCPNCGGTVAETDRVCEHCGASLNAPSQGGAGQPGRGGQSQGQADGQPVADPRQLRTESPPDEGRRDLVKYGIAALGLAGVGTLLLDDDSEQEEPPLDTGSEVQRNPQAGVSFDDTSDGVVITIQSIQRADSIEVDCGDGTFHDWEDDAGKDLSAGSSLTCGGSEAPTYEPKPGDTVTIRATYDGNTVVLQKFDVE